MSTILNVNGILQRSKAEPALPIYTQRLDEEALWGWIGKTYGLQLRDGPTAWMNISHNAIFCVLGENGQVHQIERLQWSSASNVRHTIGAKEPDRFKNNDTLQMQADIERKLKGLEWTNDHTNGCDRAPLTAFKRLFPLAEGKEHHNQFFHGATCCVNGVITYRNPIESIERAS